MISPRIRAVTLLAAVFVVGVVAGVLYQRSKAEPARSPASRRVRSTYATNWLRAAGMADSLMLAGLDSAWVTNECVTDSIQRDRIGAQSESLIGSFRPVLDSLREVNRAGMRALLPDSLQLKYDSLVAADDSSRNRGRVQRTSRGGNCSEAWMRWNNREATRGSAGSAGSGRSGRGR